MKALIALAALVPAAGLLTVRQDTKTIQRATVQKAVGGTRGESHDASSPPFEYYTSLSDFVGRKTMLEGQVVDVIDVGWGVNHQNFLMLAYMVVVNRAGQVIEIDDTDSCMQVFDRLEDMKGFWLLTGNLKRNADRKVWIEEMRFSTMKNGRFNIAFLSGKKTASHSSSVRVIVGRPGLRRQKIRSRIAEPCQSTRSVQSAGTSS